MLLIDVIFVLCLNQYNVWCKRHCFVFQYAPICFKVYDLLYKSIQKKSGQFLKIKEAFRIHLHFPWFPIHASEFLISALLLNRLNTQRTFPHSKEWMNAIPPSVQCLEVGTQFVWLMIFLGIYSCKRCYFALPKKLGKGGIENVKEVLIFHFNNRGWYSLKEKIAKSGCPPQKG